MIVGGFVIAWGLGLIFVGLALIVLAYLMEAR